MRFDIVTLFPDLFTPFLKLGVTRRAYESGQIEVRLWYLRDFAGDPYRRVDDRPFGGGPGMILMAEPLALCVEAVRANRREASAGDSAPVVLFSPAGRVLDQQGVRRWAASEGAVLICGRYEGVDQRFIEGYVDEQISLGDFVLSGGEIAALALLDAVARLQPGVLRDALSFQEESFDPSLNGLLDGPQYTRPELWRELAVPEVLLSGDHARIGRWHAEQRVATTARQRPDLLSKAKLA